MKGIRLLACVMAVLTVLAAAPLSAAAENVPGTAPSSVADETPLETEPGTEAAGAAPEDSGESEGEPQGGEGGDAGDAGESEESGIPTYEDYTFEHFDTGVIAEPLILATSELSPDSENCIAMPFTVTDEGYYVLSFEYRYAVSGNKNIRYDVLIDGALPFQEAAAFTLPRMWTNENEITEDSNGDDVSPKQVEAQIWRAYTLYDKEGYYADPLLFYLMPGAHTLTVVMSAGDAQLKNVTLSSLEAPPTYRAYLSDHGGERYDGDPVVVQGEAATYKSEMYIIPQNDITSPLNQPYSPAKIKLNTLGGANWKLRGETAVWEIENVPQAGLYRLGIRFRQNVYEGVSAHRKLYINGQVPFEEAATLSFPYSPEWQTLTLSDGEEPLYVYLEKGDNEIALEAVLGDSAEIARELQELVLELNTIYRDVIMITGSSPDDYRDYSIDEQIPSLAGDLEKAGKRLAEIAEEITATYGSDSTLASKLDGIVAQMQKVTQKPSSIAQSGVLSTFKSNISTIGSWIGQFTEQPLQIDRMEFFGESGTAPQAKANFAQSVAHSVRRFIASFTEDYSTMGSVEGGGRSITVWVQSGRDQVNVIKQLITSDFTPKTGIGVNLELVTGAIIEATLAGQGPDIGLSRPVADPVNFAMRGALYDLSSFDDYEQVAQNFVPGADIPFTYRGGVYALPETMTYQMMFCRTDILEELGLEVPKTWDELLTLVYPIVSRNNMDIGIGNMNQIAAMNASNIFTNLLYQMGGQIYNDDLTATALNTQVAYDAFRRAVEMYRDYLFPQEYDAMSRFRTGEMPILLADYAMYNVFSISIPELDGLWEMYPIPGVLKEDGTVDNSQAATETASVMFQAIEDPQAGWEFLKWWVSDDVQADFGARIEAVLGSGGRYATANTDAVEQLPWRETQLSALREQMDSLIFVEQPPGSYFTSRAINSAFMTSVLNSENPTEQLLYWSEQIDLELARKTEEFSR